MNERNKVIVFAHSFLRENLGKYLSVTPKSRTFPLHIFFRRLYVVTNRSNDLKYFPRQFGARIKTRPRRGGGRVIWTVRKVFLFKIRDILINQMKTMTFYSLWFDVTWISFHFSIFKGNKS